MKRLLAWVGVAVAGFVALTILARWIGQLQEPPARAILAPEDCSQPCWHNIRPSQTTLPGAEEILRADSTFRITRTTAEQLCWEMPGGVFAYGCAFTWKTLGYPSDKIEIITFFARENAFSLGDALGIYGRPVAFQLPCTWANGNVYFGANIIAATPAGLEAFTVNTTVLNVSYVGTNNRPWYGPKTPRWRGFQGKGDQQLCQP